MMKAIIITLLKKQDGFSNTIDNWIIANNSDVFMLLIIYSISMIFQDLNLLRRLMWLKSDMISQYSSPNLNF